jgi:hydrogenase expression/formation protein HypC
MCLGIIGEIVGPVAGHQDLFTVRVEGTDRPVNIGLLRADGVPDPRPGEWVLIHLGFALSVVDEAEARASLRFVTGVDGAFGDRPERS